MELPREEEGGGVPRPALSAERFEASPLPEHSLVGEAVAGGVTGARARARARARAPAAAAAAAAAPVPAAVPLLAPAAGVAPWRPRLAVLDGSSDANGVGEAHDEDGLIPSSGGPSGGSSSVKDVMEKEENALIRLLKTHETDELGIQTEEWSFQYRGTFWNKCTRNVSCTFFPIRFSHLLICRTEHPTVATSGASAPGRHTPLPCAHASCCWICSSFPCSSVL